MMYFISSYSLGSSFSHILNKIALYVKNSYLIYTTPSVFPFRFCKRIILTQCEIHISQLQPIKMKHTLQGKNLSLIQMQSFMRSISNHSSHLFFFSKFFFKLHSSFSCDLVYPTCVYVCVCVYYRIQMEVRRKPIKVSSLQCQCASQMMKLKFSGITVS